MQPITAAAVAERPMIPSMTRLIGETAVNTGTDELLWQSPEPQNAVTKGDLGLSAVLQTCTDHRHGQVAHQSCRRAVTTGETFAHRSCRHAKTANETFA